MAAAVRDFEVNSLSALLQTGSFREIYQWKGNSLLAMSSFQEELVNPGALATIFQG
jgi:hypothetical protein